MKKILLIAALAGFTAASGYAQNNRSCSCKHKTVHKTVHHQATVQNKDNSVNAVTGFYTPAPLHQQPDNLSTLNTDIDQKAADKLADEPCYTYRQHNIVVTQCPGILYDDAGNMYYGTQGVYLGHYPKHRTAAQRSNDDDNFKGRAPSGGDLCLYNCR